MFKNQIHRNDHSILGNSYKQMLLSNIETRCLQTTSSFGLLPKRGCVKSSMGNDAHHGPEL